MDEDEMSEAGTIAREARFMALLIAGALNSFPLARKMLKTAVSGALTDERIEPIQREAALKILDILEPRDPTD